MSAQILEREEYIEQAHGKAQNIDYGFELDLEDRQRRYVIISLLQAEGISRPAYLARFHTNPLDDLPQLVELQQRGLAEIAADRIRLTPDGLERSDVIGPWLFSSKVRRLMESYEWD